MSIKTFKKIFLLLIVCISFFNFEKVKSADSVDVFLNVMGCNNNFVCEPVIGEDETTCPNDCVYIPPPPTPTTTPTTGGITGSIQRPQIEITRIDTTQDSVKISWTSNVPTNASVEWTNMQNNQTGIIQEVGFAIYHVIYIPNLNSNTRYFINIKAVNLNGAEIYKNLEVSTDESTSFILPVKNFNIYSSGTGAVLSWQNPASSFDYVRIVKSESFFPTSPFDGNVIYEGKAQSFFDSDILENKRYFYSIFVKTEEGFSTGVTNYFIKKGTQEEFGDVGQPIGIFGPIFDPALVRRLDGSLLQNYLNFYQDGKNVTSINNVFYLENKKEVLVTIDKFSGVDSKSQISIRYFNTADPKNAEDYVFEYDSKQKKFITNFMINNTEPNTPFILYIKKDEQIYGYMGYFSTSISVLEGDEIEYSFWRDDFWVSFILFLSFIFILNFWWIILFWRRKKEEKEEEIKKYFD